MSQVRSINPADGNTVWQGDSATAEQVAQAIASAASAWPAWSLLPIVERAAVLQRFKEAASARVVELADMIRLETGKTRSDALGEAKLLPAKIDTTLEAWAQRCATRRGEGSPVTATRYDALGVVAVLGPFNFPMHLPNGHVAPALLAGNAVVFKPSEKTPGSGALYASLWADAGLPAGLLHVVQGDREVATAVVDHSAVSAVLFTGSYRAGQALSRRLADRPEVLLALEMGGNNALVVHDPGDITAAAKVAALSAFASSGQRCTCARRIVVTDGPWAQPFVDALASEARRMTVGAGDAEPEPALGPVISVEQGRVVQASQERMMGAGCGVLVRLAKQGDNDAMLSPGLLDATGVALEDEETFGPLSVVVRVRDYESALREANRTRYGLSASLLCKDRVVWERFCAGVRAGVVNWNLPTTGASGKLAFGGIGRSGNHRPAGFHSVDYCAFAKASMEKDAL